MQNCTDPTSYYTIDIISLKMHFLVTHIAFKKAGYGSISDFLILRFYANILPQLFRLIQKFDDPLEILNLLVLMFRHKRRVSDFEN